MEVALSNIERLHAQSRALMSQASTSPSLSHSSPEPQSTSPIARIPNISAVHGAMLSHSHDLLSKLHKTSYSSPPPIACSPENNVCKLISYRNAKIAAFVVDGRELICLPQAFELFLKHLVGGLHTVYTKLKRLDITPVVCNVEQVRVLRGLGAIQPGVNRCKLISCKEFDILYDDCTNSSARPGRPPKRSPSLHASPETIDKLKKARFDSADYYSTRLFDTKSFLNGFPPHPYAMGHLPFMQLNHPLLPPPVTLAMAQQLGLRHDGLIGRDLSHMDTDRLTSSDEHKASHSPKPTEPPHFHPAYQRPTIKDTDMNTPLNLRINGHADDSRKSPSIKSENDDDDIDDDNLSDDDDKSAENNGDLLNTANNPDPELEDRNRSQCQSAPPSLDNTPLGGYSSIETLLMNIQGLVKVAAENARHQDRKNGMEKAELKMEIYQQKKLRDDLEKEIKDLNSQIDVLQRRLKKERKARRRLEGHTDNQSDRHPNGGFNHDLNNLKAKESDRKERNPSGSSSSSLSDIDRNQQHSQSNFTLA